MAAQEKMVARGDEDAQRLGAPSGSAARSPSGDQTADLTGGLGTNGVSDNYTQGEAFFGEVIMTFVPMYVVLETACNPKNAGNIVLAPVAIGFAVFIMIIEGFVAFVQAYVFTVLSALCVGTMDEKLQQ